LEKICFCLSRSTLDNNEIKTCPFQNNILLKRESTIE